MDPKRPNLRVHATLPRHEVAPRVNDVFSHDLAPAVFLLARLEGDDEFVCEAAALTDFGLRDEPRDEQVEEHVALPLRGPRREDALVVLNFTLRATRAVDLGDMVKIEHLERDVLAVGGDEGGEA